MERVIIMGAAGRDFHNFNVYFRDNPRYQVVAFTAAQIPAIEDRFYPPELAGDLYPDGIPIYPEKDLPELIEKHRVDLVAFSYSDVPHVEVMHKASLAMAEGADFILIGATYTMLRSRKPVIAVCAVRTGAANPRPPGRSRRFSGDWESGWSSSAIPCPTAICAARSFSVSPPTRTSRATTAPSKSGRNMNPSWIRAWWSMPGWITGAFWQPPRRRRT